MEPARTAPPAETAATVIAACRCRSAWLMETAWLMKIETAMAMTDTSDEFWYERLRDGRFPGKKVGRGWRVSAEFVHRFLKAPSGTDLEDFAAQWMARESAAAS